MYSDENQEDFAGHPTDKISAAQIALDDAERISRPTKLEKKMDRIDDKLDFVYDFSSKAQSSFKGISHPIQEAVESSKRGRQIETSIDDFFHGLPAFIDFLQEFGTIHPYLNAVIKAFTIVYTCEKTRRVVEQNIVIVLIEMKEMLTVLQRLDGIDKDGLAEEDKKQLQDLSDLTAEDIKACGNTCSMYSNRTFADKLIKASYWQKRFTDIIAIFKERQMAFNYALSRITATTSIQMNKRVIVMDRNMDKIHRSMDKILQLLLNPQSPDVRKSQKSLSECKSDEDLENYLKKNRSLYLSEMDMKSIKKDGELDKKRLKETIDELKQSDDDMRKDEEQNFKKFRILFDLQKQNIENIVKHESDRTIGELTKAIEGPVNKIVDKDIYAIWQEGGWKGSVKARHFILALRDYFHDQDEKAHEEQHTHTPSIDRWAFQYIDIPYLQPILEAIDDDASGFIRISEVNAFTASRPPEWSLPRWIAFWAVGWHTFVRKEVAKIHAIFGEMFSVLNDIRRENQPSAEAYLTFVWKTVLELTGPPDDGNSRTSYVIDRFASFIETEETRLREKLEVMNYDIDDIGTVKIIVGPGRIEKNVFILLRLLLERHLEVFRLCKDLTLHQYELVDAAESVLCVMEAVRGRYLDLKTLFASQRLDAKLQFKTFEYGLFQYINEPLSLWPKGLSECRSIAAPDSDSESESESESESKQVSNLDLGPKLGDTNNNNNDSEGAAIALRALADKILNHKLDETDPETLFFSLSPSCDCCEEDIDQNRIICLDCVSSDGLWNTVDFCTTNPNCVQRQTIGRSDLLKEHNRQHNLLLLRQIPHVYLILLAFYLKDDHSIYQRAFATIQRTQDRVFADSVGQEQVSCVVCKGSIVFPFWTCIFCSDVNEDRSLDNGSDQATNDDNLNEGHIRQVAGGKTPLGRYICSNCVGSTEDFDDRYHMYVRCPPKVEEVEDMSLESRLSRVEAMLQTLLGLHNIPKDLE